MGLSCLTNYLNDSESKTNFYWVNKIPIQLLSISMDVSMDEAPRKSNDISLHYRNIQMLMIELYKIKNELALH